MNISLWIIKFELDQMSNYLELVGSAIEQRLEEIEEIFSKEAKHEMSEIEAMFFNDRWTDEYFDTGRGFPQLLLTSFIIAWYAFVEQQLFKLCDDLRLKITVRPRDNSNFGKGIWRAKKILENGKGYFIKETHWKELTKISQLRNLIVHSGTDISWSYVKPNKRFVSHGLDDDKKTNVYLEIDEDFYQHLTRHKIIEHKSISSEIRPNFEYCNYLINFGRDFFSKIHSDLYPRKQQK